MLAQLREISYVRLIVPFCLGIVSFVFLPVHPAFPAILFALSACLCVLLLFRYVNWFHRQHRLQWIPGCATNGAMFIAGYLLCANSTEINDTRHFSCCLKEESLVLVQVDEPLAESEKTYKTIGKIIAVRNGTENYHTIGKALLYIRKDSAAAGLKYGDRFWIKNNFASLPEPKNPREFNYKRFMSFRQINYQAFLDTDDWKLHSEKGGNLLIEKTLALRSLLLGILKKYIADDQAYAVSSSLILGLREKLDDELIKAYSSSGAMHVLAVSGLHVAIMYEIISRLLFFLNYHTKSRIFKSVVIVLVIWGYAALTGLSPSVLRSAVMFTFVALGSNLKRRTNIYNMLAASAFALLLYNPYFLMEVGFQLSYLAVVGIIMLQPKIYPLYYTSNWVLDKIWMITAVSIAAQVATFPLGLLYYYQFPVYFLVSNLFVIPVSTAILYLGVALFMVSWIPGLNAFVGFLLEKSLLFMNQVVLYIDSLPYALLQGISISVPEAWFIYSSIACVVAFIYWRRNSLLVASLVWLVLLFGWSLFEQIQNQRQEKLIVYSVAKNTAVDFICGTDHIFVADSVLLNDYDRMLFHIKHNWWDSGLHSATAGASDNFSLSFVKREKGYIQFLDKKIVLLNQPPDGEIPLRPLAVDYVILSKDADVGINTLTKFYNFSKLIFDSSNSWKRVKNWKADCEKVDIPYYDVSEQGAYVENL